MDEGHDTLHDDSSPNPKFHNSVKTLARLAAGCRSLARVKNGSASYRGEAISTITDLQRPIGAAYEVAAMYDMFLQGNTMPIISLRMSMLTISVQIASHRTVDAPDQSRLNLERLEYLVST